MREQRHQHDVLENVGVIARMECVSIAEHGRMMTYCAAPEASPLESAPAGRGTGVRPVPAKSRA